MKRISTSFAALVIAAGVVSCGGGDGANSEPAAVVAVPNPLIAHLVERIACTGGVEIRVDGESVVSAGSPAVEIVVQRPDLDAAATGPMVVSVHEAVPTIDVGNGEDPWVWLDPVRMNDLSRTIGGALVAADVAEPAVVDRCLGRLDGELERLADEILAIADTLPDEQRIIDVAEPGTVYFADRFGFTLDISRAAAEAGRIMSADDLDGFDTYEAMMLAHLDEAVDVLRTPP